MSLADYLDEDKSFTFEVSEPKDSIRVEEGQLIIAALERTKLYDFQKIKKTIDEQEKIIKKNIENVMREYGITKYESPDKTLMITLGEDGTTETVDKEKLFLKYPDVYRDEEIVKETPRKGSLRITVREGKDEKTKL